MQQIRHEEDEDEEGAGVGDIRTGKGSDPGEIDGEGRSWRPPEPDVGGRVGDGGANVSGLWVPRSTCICST